MSLAPLTVVPAGAGSGKTFRIQQDLGAWVERGLVAPERIVAVTFTEAAAAGLRERIRTRLLELGRLEDALRLDQAYISTIHSFGLRILKEFAFDAGQSPQPRLLNADEESTLIRQALVRTRKAEPVLMDLAAFGYRYDVATGRSAADQFRDHVLEVVALLRSVGWRGHDPRYAGEANAWIAARYPALGDGKRATRALRQRVDALLEAFPENLAGHYGAGNATATRNLREDYRALREAQLDAALETDWSLWQKLRTLRRSVRGCALPSDYDALATEVIAAADALLTHPGPLAHAGEHVDALLGAGQEVLVHYAAAKREAGLVDFTDMIASSDRLLRDRPEVLAELRRRIDCLVVDEFQDTNPLQFALLWRLKEAGIPTLIVGDIKQAIMGFQGGDPRLLEALIAKHRGVVTPLARNWRSQPPLMEFINAIGPGLFGEQYTCLAPHGETSTLEPLEVIEFAAGAGSQQAAVRAACVGERLQALLADRTQRVFDRHTKSVRPLQGRDIAILCQRHKVLDEYARVLRAQGLRVRLEEGGWFESRAVQLAWYAIAYVANPADKHAALYLAVTELGQRSLEEGVAELVATGTIEHPLLARLEAIAETAADRTVYAAVSEILQALALFDDVAHWPDAVQARANLLRLQAEAGEFMETQREARASGGFHGEGLATFQAWLLATLADEKKNKQPAPRVLDEDAIELVTWHAAKGREWPIVVVGELDRKIEAALPALQLGYADFGALATLLEGATVEYSPQFAAPETRQRFAAPLQEAAESEARRLVYVALTRAREKLILEWPSYRQGKNGVTPWSILTTVCGVTLEGAALYVGGARFPVRYAAGSAMLPEGLDLEGTRAPANVSLIGRRAIKRRPRPAALTPDARPAAATSKVARAPKGLQTYRYADPLVTGTDLSGVALGRWLHRYFEVLGIKPHFADRLMALSCSDSVPRAFAETVVERVVQFEAWVESRFHPARISRELPLLYLAEDRSVVSGVVDLVIDTTEGGWIIDHKSDQLTDAAEAFARYLPQLNAYAAGLEAAGRKVAGVGVHWMRYGVVDLSRRE
jgi:ATP-dependent helicase/nuclease subunit A